MIIERKLLFSFKGCFCNDINIFFVVRVVCFALVLLSGDFQYCPVRSGRRHWDGRPTMAWRWSYSVGLHSPCLGGDLRESDLAPSRLLLRFNQRFATMAFSCRLILRLRVTPYNQTLLDISQQSNSVTFVREVLSSQLLILDSKKFRSPRSLHQEH